MKKMIKMKNKIAGVIFCLCILTVLGSVCAFGQSEGQTGAGQIGAEVIRFGYAEVEEYGSFTQLLLDIAREFAEEGSLNQAFLEKYKDKDFEAVFRNGDTLKLWNDICDAQVEGARYQFSREAFFNMDTMAESDYPQMANRDDVDIMFAMGTAPGVYLFENETKNKFMSLYAADPIASGIVKSTTERYKDNTYALMDYTPFLRQLEGGYKFLQFKRLGVVCEESEIGRLQAAVPDIELKAHELGFETVYEFVDEPVDEADEERYYREMKQAYRDLIDRGIDCLYITISSIDYESMMQELLDDAIIPNHIKTLAQDDLTPLAYGALFGVTISNSEEVAAHLVEQIRSYAEEGVPFDELEMVYESTPKIGINFTTAKRIGFEIGFKDLQMVDKVYRND